jgi:hypothetical protein
MTRLCFVCKKIVPRYSKYCPRCRLHTYGHSEKKARALALIASWDEKRKGFKCHYTDVILEEKDRSSPYYLTFDHRTPGKKGDLVVCAAWVNSMKNELSEEEFRAVIIELARSRETGEPFNMAVAEFKYWKGPSPPKRGRLASLTNLRLPKIGECIVCSARTVPYSKFCQTCRTLVRQKSKIKERTAAMQDSWDPIRKAFICYLTKLELDGKNWKSPTYITFEHPIPGRLETMKMAAAFVNLMKTDLSEEEFWLAVNELAHHFQTGEAFNRDIIKFAYWKRPRMARKGKK